MSDAIDKNYDILKIKVLIFFDNEKKFWRDANSIFTKIYAKFFSIFEIILLKWTQILSTRFIDINMYKIEKKLNDWFETFYELNYTLFTIYSSRDRDYHWQWRLRFILIVEIKSWASLTRRRRVNEARSARSRKRNKSRQKTYLRN